MSDTLRIILGYVIFFGYMFLEIVIGEALQKKFDLNKEMTRKVEHMFTGVCWIIGYFFLGWTIHLFIVNLISVVLLGVITFGGLMKSIEREDAGKSYGVFYFGLSTLIVVSILVFVEDSLFPYYGIAYYCLVLADGLAPIIAKAFKKHNLTLVNGKTLVGTVTVFAITALIALAFSLIFSLHLSALLILSLAAFVAMAELFGAKGTDNLTIVFAAFGYLVLAHYGYLDVGTQAVILIAPLLTIASILTNALTPSAQTVSYLVLVAFAIFGGYPLAVLALTLFIIAAIVAKVTNKLFAEKMGSQQKSARRVIQILANGALTVILAALWFFLRERWLLLLAFVVLIEEFADSMSSDIGRLSKTSPVDILRFKRVTPGTSGGVSLLGTSASLISTFLAGLFVLLFFKDPILYVTVSGVAFLGTLIDSVLGSSLQGLFQCSVCGEITEKKVHCDAPATCIKGFAAVDNSFVNFLSGLLTAGVAAAILLGAGIA